VLARDSPSPRCESRARTTLGALALALSTAALGKAQEPPIEIRRASGPISIDGDLSDAGWKAATRIDSFVEVRPGDNTPPRVKTTLLLTYDDRFFYAAFDCEDPDPSRIRAAYSNRDDVGIDQDYAGIFLDARHDRRTVFEFFANPRGIQYDAVQDDATGNEDSSADFFWDSAGRIDARGWTLEMRIPFSSLRYGQGDPQTWGIIAYRNYSRDDRYVVSSSRIPRGSTCFVCHERDLTGLAGLPLGSHVILAPYGTAQEQARPAGGSLDSRLVNRPVEGNGGLDAKWIPNADTAIDATVNPDFSQVESDVAQISVNSRFALFYPEKRPFFLEGLELFATPIPALYTRTLTSPRWGLRATGKEDGTAYTLLVAQDRGGGSVVLPGPQSSELAPQDFDSTAVIGRVRHDLGRSFAGLLFSDREDHGGGHNRVFGPDFQWNPSQTDQVTGQVLLSFTKNLDRPDLSQRWTGQDESSFATQASWNHTTRTLAWFLELQDFGDHFRADNGFVPQVGFRRALGQLFYRFYPTGLLSRLTPLLVEDDSSDTQGRILLHRTSPGIQFQGKANSSGEIDVFFDKVRAGDRLFDRRQVSYTFALTPSSGLPNFAASGVFGEDVDFVNARIGRGAQINLSAEVRPTDHLDLQVNASRQWLDVRKDAGRSGRLFTAQVERLKVTYNFDARTFLRAIGEYVATDRDPSLYTVPVISREGTFTASALFAYKLDWQTVLFVGYGDDRVLNDRNDLVRTGRQLFLKASYAFQR
jgi:hypothetical protein